MENKIVFLSLDYYNLNVILRNYCDLLNSHYNERYKFLINSCNNKLLAYHHSITINHVELSHPICQYINYIMKEVPYSGLYSALISSSYLLKIVERFWHNRPTVSHIELISCLNKVKDFVLQFLNKEKKETELDGHRLVTIVTSKLKLLPLDKLFINCLAISITKALLLAADESSKRLGHIIIKVLDGRDSCDAYNGVLYKLESFWLPDKEIISTISNYHVLLFTEPIDLSTNSINSNICETEFINSICAANVKIVICQKSIDKKITFLLHRRKIVALERLGEESTCALAHLSGAFPISDYSSVNWKELHTLTGIISKVRWISLLDERYLLMESDSSKVVTLFVSHRSYDTSNQLKAVIREAIHLVYSVFKCPFFLPHDVDNNLAEHLRNEVTKDVKLKQMLTLFAATIEKTCPTTSKELVDPSDCSDVYLIKRNNIAQAFSTVGNILQLFQKWVAW